MGNSCMRAMPPFESLTIGERIKLREAKLEVAESWSEGTRIMWEACRKIILARNEEMTDGQLEELTAICIDAHESGALDTPEGRGATHARVNSVLKGDV